MSERSDLLISVANAIKTYREGDFPEPTPEHVDRWLHQFTPSQQLPFLREFNHVINKTFITREFVRAFLSQLVANQKLTGNYPAAYWSSANFLSIQQNGQSQKEMLRLFAECLEEKYGLYLKDCGQESGDFIYLDDVIFSGNRVISDLKLWIKNDAPQSARVHIIVVAYHTLGQYFIEKQLNESIKESRKNIAIQYWSVRKVENRKLYKDSSEVLWPEVVPFVTEVQTYMAQLAKNPFDPRQINVHSEVSLPFSSEAGRQVLESEFLIAGAKIRAMSENPKQSMRPLGFSPFGVGFGSTIVTYRNCPNNCPLAMWWGDAPLASKSLRAYSKSLEWYPLLPRKTYSSAG